MFQIIQPSDNIFYFKEKIYYFFSTKVNMYLKHKFQLQVEN